MKRVVSVLTSLALLAGCASPALAQKSPDQGPPAPAVEYNARAWKEFVSREGAFSVRMPAEPKPGRQEVNSPAGKLSNYTHMATTGVGVYAVVYMDLPSYSDSPEVVRKALDGGRDNMLASDPAKRLLSETEVSVEGHPGREWFVADRALLYRSRTFFAKGRFYQILLATSLGTAFNNGRASASASDRTDFYEGVCEKFFGSFKLLPPYAGEKPAAPQER